LIPFATPHRCVGSSTSLICQKVMRWLAIFEGFFLVHYEKNEILNNKLLTKKIIKVEVNALNPGWFSEGVAF
jgi:hypothetical protein